MARIALRDPCRNGRVDVDGLVIDARMLAPELRDEARRRGLIPDIDDHRAA